MTNPDLDRSRILSEAGAKGAATRQIGLTTLEDRRQLTAAATEARRALGVQRRAAKQNRLAERIAAVEAVLPSLPPAERLRQIALIETIKGADEQIAALRERIRQRELEADNLADRAS
jgi:hypothetical protein